MITSSLGKGKLEEWEDSFGEIQRYGLDPYEAQVYLNKTKFKNTVSLTLNHGDFGATLFQEFWTFPVEKTAEARAAYNKVKSVMNDIFEDFRDSSKPTNLITARVRETIRFINQDRKPEFRVPYLNYARRYSCETDSRSQIYGPRYPDVDYFSGF
jgi:hypothetical protein